MSGQSLLAGLLLEIGFKQWSAMTVDLVFLGLEASDGVIQIVDKDLVVARPAHGILASGPVGDIIGAGARWTHRV